MTAHDIAIHPGWSYATLSNDIAILTFSNDIEVMNVFNTSVAPKIIHLSLLT